MVVCSPRQFRQLGDVGVVARRFPPWWTVEEKDLLIVKDHAGKLLVYVYFEDEPSGRAAAKMLQSGRPSETFQCPSIQQRPMGLPFVVLQAFGYVARGAAPLEAVFHQ